MADVKISQLPASTTPLDGTEVLPIVQSATTKQVSVANLTAGRAVSALSLSLTNALPVTSGGTGLATTAAGTLLSSTALNTISATATPTLGVAGTTAGTLGLSGSTSGVVTLQTAAAAGTWALTLPTSGGTNGYILTTDGSGVTTWTNPTALGIDLNVGSTVVSDGTSGRVLYDNAGVLGEYAVTGTGTTAVLSTSPTFTTGLTTPLAIGGTTASSSLTLQSTSGVGTSDSIVFKVGNNGATTAATIDTAGNLGLGVTPSAWSGLGGKSIEVGLVGNYLAVGSANQLWLGTNAYYNAGWKYATAAAASQYYQYAGAHQWFTAASGTAGSAISFTQAMTLDASGRLVIGSTSAQAPLDVFALSNGSISLGSATYFTSLFKNNSGGYGLGVNVATSGNVQLQVQRFDGTATAYDMVLQPLGGNLLVGTTSGTGRLVVQQSDAGNPGARIYLSSGTFGDNGVMVTADRNTTNNTFYFISAYNNTAAAYKFRVADSGQIVSQGSYDNTTASAANLFVTSGGVFQRSTSSIRYKTNIQNAVHGLSDIQKLRSVTYNGINDGDKIFGGLIAEEVDAAGLIEFVVYDSEGRPDALHYGNMAGLFVKAIQELAAKVSALEAKQ